MKKLIFYACITLSLSAQAQYFDHDYGTTFIEEPQRGMNTRANHEGFIISGLTTNPTAGTTGSVVAYSDKNGNLFSAPYFVKGYRLRGPNNIAMNSRDAKVLELSSNFFGLAGTARYTIAGVDHEYIYWIELDTNGTVIATSTRLYSTPSTSYYGLNNLSLSPSSAAVYLTGWAQLTAGGGEYQPYVMKIAFNGNIIWSHTYDIDQTSVNTDMGYDVIEDPSTGDLVLVGKTDYNGSVDGFVMQLNPANGNVITMDVYGNNSSAEYFTCITPSNDATSGLGYVIGGNTDSTSGGDLDGWLLRVDNTYGAVWSNRFDYNNSQVNNYFGDVVERLDSAGNYEIYAGGTTVAGVLGSADIEVDKVVSATGAAIRQFTYGDPNGNALVSIDQNSNGANLGISMFGYRSSGYIGSSDLNIFKAYFNGVSYCNDSIDSIAAMTGPQYLNSYTPDTVYRFSVISASVNTGAGSDKTVCAGASVAGGNNRIQFIEEAVSDEVAIENMPQPNTYAIYLNKSIAGNAQIMVNDMYGRILYSNRTGLQRGENTIPLDLNPLNLRSGIYVINVYDGKIKKSRKISIIK